MMSVSDCMNKKTNCCLFSRKNIVVEVKEVKKEVVEERKSAERFYLNYIYIFMKCPA